MKNVITITTIAMLIIIAGCGPTSTNLEINIHEGTDGIEMNFIDRSPPDEAFEGERMPLTIEIRNKGAVDIENNKGLIVVGVEREYVSAPSEYFENPITFTLNGRSLYDPIGGMDRITVPLTVESLGPQVETITSVVAITSCYPYRTDATAQVCIDSDVYNERQQDKVCTPQTLSMGTVELEGQELPRGQGGPIAVTRIEQKIQSHDSPDRIRPTYLIYIQNMGDGLPIDIDSYENACGGVTAMKRTLNVVKANVYISDKNTNTQLDCNPKLDSTSSGLSGHLKLDNNEDFIRCELTGGVLKSLGTFTTPLIIDLEYGYTNTISKSILLRKQV